MGNSVIAPIKYPKLNKFQISVNQIVDDKLFITFLEEPSFRKFIGKKIYFSYDNVLYNGILLYDTLLGYYISNIPMFSEMGTVLVENSVYDVYDTFSISEDNELITFQDVVDYFIASGGRYYSNLTGTIFENYNEFSKPGLLSPFDKTKIDLQPFFIKAQQTITCDNLVWTKLTDFKINDFVFDSGKLIPNFNLILLDENNHVLNATISFLSYAQDTVVNNVLMKVNHCSFPENEGIELKFSLLYYENNVTFTRVEFKSTNAVTKEYEVYFGIYSLNCLVVPTTGLLITTPILFNTDETTIIVDKFLSEINANSKTLTSVKVLFENDILVSLDNNKTLGRYINGDIIPSKDKTTEQVLNLIASEPIKPLVTLSSSTTVGFNQTSINNYLTFGYEIKSIGAVIKSVLLECKHNSDWQTLISDSLLTSFNHIFVDTAFNQNTFQYRYTVVDSLDATTVKLFTITPQTYVAPTINFNVFGQSLASFETNIKRENGNTASIIGGSASRNSPFVPLVSYEYFVNDTLVENFVSIAGVLPLNAVGGTFTNANHGTTPTINKLPVTYKLIVTDAYTTNIRTITINYLNLIFYGSKSVLPENSVAIRNLSTKRFTDDSQTFDLSTGTTNDIFAFAIPNTKSLVSVVDLDALNANVTSNYILSTFDVEDFGGIPIGYKIYVLENSLPYPTNHRHQITIN